MSNNDLWCNNCESHHHPANLCKAEADGYHGGFFTIRGDAPRIIMTEPKWGEEILVGMFCGEEQKIRRPMNQEAINQMDTVPRVVLMLHDRILELEQRLEQVEVGGAGTGPMLGPCPKHLAKKKGPLD